jgi:hypothetical protein
MNGYLTCQGPGYGSIIVFAGVGWQGQKWTINMRSRTSVPSASAM